MRMGYITRESNQKGSKFGVGENIDEALKYINDWGITDGINWLIDNFRYKGATELELFATVDMAICDLTKAGKPATLQTIKHLIATNKEWRAKLNKPIFNDDKINRAIRELQSLLPKEDITDGENR